MNKNQKRWIFIPIDDADRLINQPLTRLEELATALAYPGDDGDESSDVTGASQSSAAHDLCDNAATLHEHFCSDKFFPSYMRLLKQGRPVEEMEPEGLWLDADDVQKFGNIIREIQAIDFFSSTDEDHKTAPLRLLMTNIEQTHTQLLDMLSPDPIAASTLSL